MATIVARVDDDLKAQSFLALQELGVTPSELIRQTLQYVAYHKKIPFKTVVLTDEDSELLALAKERLDNPAPRIKVSLDEF
ncbi:MULTISPECIES: type II toxin-antitoxin system RelB/DinJ family antitoxin [Moraxella]|jgi:antitoxin relB|uniref:Antitoxin RelB n=1 Tax=Moraxella lacunata TaxID=477 RepID=A0A1B8Q5H2_MORLA|nr:MULTISPECIES: type II toxin-antitoxin system RelB/DinJ family antitoxin [Moraxella]MBE9588025.1 type II toxin-antitoxin system RelB/DinJ family antitoxin [Moraxella sp. K1630]MBE9595400.1 type II toxin-antitoxin system RelB/DinJ family antitoxin [Moraxella sp. K2450]MDH9219408.1 type II toxin-antitoxin system RelB/DinJ family antitoxin [Moraxella lacunata]MDI4483331.1 type II toxin-antitoxin system RelB/DinJ family antitoxin [Moraxella lacunata]MDI4507805.1 type II toxin-antitoxin system Re